MSQLGNIAEHVGRLLSKALDAKRSPVNDNEYRALLRTYAGSAEFRDVFEGVTKGLQLQVLSVDDYGAFIAPATSDSPFAVNIGDLRAVNLKTEQRALMVLIHMTTAALFYPTADKLFDDSYDAPPVTERQISAFLRDMCSAIKASVEAVDYPRELEPAWVLLQGMPEVLPDQQRHTLNTLEGLINVVCRQLQDAGLVRQDADEGSPRYGATRRFATQLRHHAVEVMFKSIRQLVNQVQIKKQG
jgi:hypothetical protein